MTKRKETVKAKPEAAIVAAPVKRIAIVGCSDTKNLAPYNDPSWQIWAMNNAFGHIKKADAWFEIHPIKMVNGNFLRRKLIRPGIFEWSPEFRGQEMTAYLKAIAALDCPVYMQQHWDIVPKSVAFPLKEIVGRFGRYFTNSVSYMIALAILQGAKEIGCWGVDMSTGSEWGPQRPSCEYFLGIATGLGIKVTMPEQADLLKTRFMYGFEEREQCAWEKKITQMLEAMEGRKQKALMQFETANKQIQQYVGAMEATKEIERVWSNLMDTKIWTDPV